MTAIVYIAFALLGLSVGSFLNLCIDRLPAGKSIVRPGSHCDSCGTSLRVVDLVPVLSYIFLRGRCRYCGAQIPVRLPLVEFATAALFCLLLWNYSLSLELAFALVYASLFLVVFFIDLDHGLILDVVVFTGLALALVFSFFWGGFDTFWPKVGPGIVVSSLLGAAIGFVVLLLPYVISRGGMGYGDVKLAALIGLMNGFPLVLVAILIGIILGGLFATLLLVSRLVKRRDAIPFGPFLVVGAMASLVWGESILNWYQGSFLTSLASGL